MTQLIGSDAIGHGLEIIVDPETDRTAHLGVHVGYAGKTALLEIRINEIAEQVAHAEE